MLERPLRALSIIAVSIVFVGFIVFAVAQGHTATATQKYKIDGHTVVTTTKHHSALHRKVDSIDRAVLSPFNGIVDGVDSEWFRRGVGSLLALAVYGLGLGGLARYAHGRPYRGR